MYNDGGVWGRGVGECVCVAAVLRATIRLFTHELRDSLRDSTVLYDDDQIVISRQQISDTQCSFFASSVSAVSQQRQRAVPGTACVRPNAEHTLPSD